MERKQTGAPKVAKAPDRSVFLEERRGIVAGAGSIVKSKLFGDPLGKKDETTARLCYEQVGGLAPWRGAKTSKIPDMKKFVKRLEADGLFCVEVNTDWRKVPFTHQLPQLFSADAQSRFVVSNNVNEDKLRSQVGGTCGMIFGELAKHVKDVGKDLTGLGRWSWVLLEGANSHRTRIVTAYQPSLHKLDTLDHMQTVYRQHANYFRTNHGDRTCPRKLFRDQLIAQLATWKEEGDKLVLFIDANDCLKSGKFVKQLRKDVGMDDLVRRRTGTDGPPTFTKGLKVGTLQIDGCFATEDIDCTGARFLPFRDGVGDHRTIAVDITYRSLIGEDKFKVVRPDARRLQVKKRGTLRRYLKLMRELTAELIKPRLNKLYASAHTPFTAEEVSEFEAIDKLETECMLLAEKRCRRLKYGFHDWSPALQSARRRLVVWRTTLRWHDGRNVCRKFVRRKAKTCGIVHPFSLSREEVVAHIASNLREQDRIQSHAPMLRELHLRSNMKKARESGDIKKATEIKAIIRREVVIRNWRVTNHVLKPRGPQILHVETVADDNVLTVHDTKESLETATMQCLSERFSMAASSTFNQGKLQEDLGRDADRPAAKQILRGTYDVPRGTDRHTQGLIRIIHKVAAKVGRSRNNRKISRSQFQQHWRGAKEKTSSSKANLHFGHYISTAKDDVLSECKAMKLDLIARCGYSPNRWGHGMSCLLEKKPGVRLVNKLRGILLLEGDCNMFNKVIFGIRMIDRGTKANVIPQENHARRGSTAIEVAFLRLLTLDVSRQRRHFMAMASVDAANCYDRVGHTFLSLACQAFGTPVSAVKVMTHTLAKMKFYLRSGFGDSTRFFGGDPDNPMEGLCQGSGAAPAVWLVVSALLIHYMQEQGCNIEIRSALSASILRLCSWSFVDDSDIPVFETGPTDTEIDLLQRLQHAVSIWEGGLRATGGALTLLKSFLTIALYRWKQDGTYFYADPSEAIPVYLSPDGVPAQIDTVHPDMAKEIMGVWQCASGKMDTQIEMMQAKLMNWVAKIEDGKLHRRNAWMAFWGTIWRTFKYGLPVMTMTEPESIALFKPFYWKLLPALGIMRTTNRKWIFTPRCLQGLGLPTIFLEQTIDHIDSLMYHYGSGTFVGDAMVISYEQLQLELGTLSPVFSLDFDRWGFLGTDSWILALWRGVSRFHVNITLPQQAQLPVQRHRDIFLMDGAFRLHLRADEMLSFNRVRNFLRVYSLADITSMDGIHIRPEFRTPGAVKLGGGASSTYVWRRDKPAESDWPLWVSIIKRLTSENFKLQMPLERWLVRPHRHLPWRLHTTSGCLLEVSVDNAPLRKFKRPESAKTRETSLTFSTEDADHDGLVGDCRYADVLKTGDSYVVTSSCATTPDKQTSVPVSVRAFLRESGQEWVWRHLDKMADHAGMAWAIERGHVIAVTDGSYYHDRDQTKGAAGWILECQASGKRVGGVLRSPGTVANAYRSELSGLYAILAYINAVAVVYSITSGNVLIGCDNIVALNKSSDQDRRVRSPVMHGDIIRAIQHYRHKLPDGIALTFEHVRGHQDRVTAYEDLPRIAQLNVQMDSKAKSFLASQITKPDPIGEFFDGTLVVVRIGESTAHTAVGHLLRFEVGLRECRDTLMNDQFSSVEAFDAVNWRAVGAANCAASILFSLWTTKHVSGFNSTNKMGVHWGIADNSKCPCCEDAVESSAHHTFCPQKDRATLWRHDVHDLVSWLKSVNTDPCLTGAITTYLFSRGTRDFSSCTADHSIMALSSDVDSIGFLNISWGRLPTAWSSHQDAFYRDIGSRRSGHTWSKTLSHRLISLVHSQWLFRCSFVHDRGLDGLEEKTREKLFHDMEAQFNLGSVGLEEDDLGLFGISWKDLWQKSGLDKLGWLDAVKAARGSSRLHRTARANDQHSRRDSAHFFTSGAHPQRQRTASCTPQRPITRSTTRARSNSLENIPTYQNMDHP